MQRKASDRMQAAVGANARGGVPQHSDVEARPKHVDGDGIIGRALLHCAS